MDVTDDELIGKYLDGDMVAFETLYHRYDGRLLGFLLAMRADRDLAEDLAQKTWLKVIGRFANYEARGTFRAWLFTVARRLWIDEARSAWSRKRVALESSRNGESGGAGKQFDVEDPSSGPAEHALARERRGMVTAAIRSMPPELSQTVLLRIDGDLTYREIAEEMGCPLGTALWRAKEAERRIRKFLGIEVTEKTR